MAFNRNSFVIILAALAVSNAGWASSAKATDSDDSDDSDAVSVTTTRKTAPRIPAFLKGVMIRPIAAFNFTSPSDVNNFLGATNSALKIGTGGMYGGAIDVPVLADTIYLGARIAYFTSSSDAANLGQGVGTAQANISGVPMMLTATGAYQLMQDLHVGVQGGFGFVPGFNASVTFAGRPQGAQIPNGTLTYGSNPITGMGLLFTQYDFTKHVGARVEGGYSVLSSSQMSQTSSFAGSPQGTLMTDAQGNNLNVNAGAFFAGLSLAVIL